MDGREMSTLEQRLIVAPFLRRKHYMNGSCGRCGTPWPVANYHNTKFCEHGGCFPLCEDCWQELETPEARLPYYRELMKWWDETEVSATRDEAVFAAVMEGK